jgi:hypothetical protein
VEIGDIVKVTNEQIMYELRSIRRSLPNNSRCVNNINKDFKNMSYNQSVMRSDIKEIIQCVEHGKNGSDCGNK